MRNKTAYTLVGVLALVVVIMHAFLALSVPGMSTDNAYLHLRQVESIRDSWLPLTDDPLAPTGSRLLVTPLYDYLLAFSSVFVSPIDALKIVPSLLAGVLVLLVFRLSFKITHDGTASLFAAVATAVMPAFLGSSINTADPAALILAMTTAILLQLTSLSQKSALSIYALLIILLSFIHPSVILVLFGLLFYAGLLVIEELRHDKGLFEVLLFSTLFIVWSLAVRFKDVLVLRGPDIVFQNIPNVIRESYVSQPPILDTVLLIGVIPSLAGAYVIYRHVFRERRRDIYLLLGFALAMTLLLWLGIVRPLLGIMFLGLVMSVLFGVWVRSALDYLKRTHVAPWHVALTTLLLVLLAVSSLWPAILIGKRTLAQAPSPDELESLALMSERLPSDAVVLTLPDEGFRVQALAGTRTVQDMDFMLQDDAAQRFEDVRVMFSSPYKVSAIALLKKYDVTYLYISPAAKKRFDYERPLYADDECFATIHDGAALVLQSLCRVERQ